MPKPIKPSKYPVWASDNIRDEVWKEWNVIEPTEEEKAIGYQIRQSPVSQYMNWLHRTSNEWIMFFDQNNGFLQEYNKANLPDATQNKGLMVFVSDVDGGCIGVSNGAKWKKISLTNDV